MSLIGLGFSEKGRDGMLLEIGCWSHSTWPECCNSRIRRSPALEGFAVYRYFSDSAFIGETNIQSISILEIGRADYPGEIMDTRKLLPVKFTIPAKPYNYVFPTASTALLMIDMQRDFLLPGGFGDLQTGSNLDAVRRIIANCECLLKIFRKLELPVFHTREGHLPDLSDCPSSKLTRQAAAPDLEKIKVIGDMGDMGRLLVRGEYGHDLMDGCKAKPWEVVVDKPGKGAFWNTTLHEQLLAWEVTHLVVGGVTTECCVTTTVREANDRGFECCILEECTAGYNAAFKTSSLDMIHWSQGLFGFVASLNTSLAAMSEQLAPSSILETPDPEKTLATPMSWDGSLTITSLRASYTTGLSPVTVVHDLYKKIHTHISITPSTFIYLVPESLAVRAAETLAAQYSDLTSLPPLFGIPFSLKDSIDVAGIPTTVACPPFTHTPSVSATVYVTLISLGALFIGKTNLDQLATGLTGCRSPYGIPRSVCNPLYISGGSSSGAAVSVGASLVSFAVGTDTAGSIRVPAAFNGVVGWKPTKGTVSLAGVAKACESLDCLSLMATRAGGTADVRRVWTYLRGYDPEDAYSKSPHSLPLYHIQATGAAARNFRFAVPPQWALAVCSPIFRHLFYEVVETLLAVGGEMMEVDWDLFEDAGRLLYDGALVNERLAAMPGNGREWFEREKEGLHEVTRAVFSAVLERGSGAEEVYRDLKKMTVLTRRANETVFHPSGIDVLVVPTTPTHFTVEEVMKDPVGLNSVLGTFMHFGNVLDLCGAAVPAGWYEVDGVKMPFSVTFMGRGGSDGRVLGIAGRFEGAVGIGAGMG